MNTSLTVVDQFLRAVQSGDNATVAALLHPDIVWEQPGAHRFSGVTRGTASVFEMIGGMYAASGNTFALSRIDFIGASGPEVACLLQFTASNAAGAALDTRNIDVYTVDGAQITRVRVFTDDTAQEDAFWGN